MPNVELFEQKTDRGTYGNYSRSVSDEAIRSIGIETPRTDENGNMRVLFAPGKHVLHAGIESLPDTYRPIEPFQEIDLQPGKPVELTFKLRKTTQP